MALAVVNKTKVTGSSVASVTTPALATTSGNLIHVAFVWYLSVANFTSLVDSLGATNTYTYVVNATTGGAISSESRHMYSSPITGNAAMTWTATFSANTYPSVSIIQISGQSASPLDIFGFANTTGLSTHTVSTASPTTQNDEIVLASCGGNSVASAPFTITCDAAYTDQNNMGDASTTTPFDCASRIRTTTGTLTSTFTSSPTGNMALIISSFKAGTVVPERMFCTVSG